MPVKAVITGMGSVSPYGRGVGTLWDGLVAGRRALRPITLFPTEGLRSPLGGEVPGYPPPGEKVSDTFCAKHPEGPSRQKGSDTFSPREADAHGRKWLKTRRRLRGIL